MRWVFGITLMMENWAEYVVFFSIGYVQTKYSLCFSEYEWRVQLLSLNYFQVSIYSFCIHICVIWEITWGHVFKHLVLGWRRLVWELNFRGRSLWFQGNESSRSNSSATERRFDWQQSKERKKRERKKEERMKASSKPDHVWWSEERSNIFFCMNDSKQQARKLHSL